MIGTRLKQHRLARKLSQGDCVTELKKRYGVAISQAALSRFEASEKGIGGNNLIAVKKLIMVWDKEGIQEPTEAIAQVLENLATLMRERRYTLKERLQILRNNINSLEILAGALARIVPEEEESGEH